MKKIIIQGLSLTFCLLCLWQSLIIIFQLPEFILPSPHLVLITFVHNFQIIMHEARITLTETLFGLLFGSLFACTIALFMMIFKRSAFLILPIIVISQALPTFAIAPLLVVWFGFGILAKIITTVIMIFFLIASSFYDGLQATPISWIELAKTMNAKPLKIFWCIRIPSALPALASGLRVATAIAPMGAIVGEWVGASQGLGFLMLNANERMQIDLMFAALIIIILFSLALYFIVDQLLLILIPWQVKT